MIDPEAIHPAAGAPVEHQGVGLGENLGILHVQRDQVVHIEEAAVVDLARRPPPVHQPIDLRFEQPGEPPGSVRSRAEGLGGGLDFSRNRGVLGRVPQPVERIGGAAAPLLDRAGAPGGAAGQPPQPVDGLGHGDAAGVLGAQPLPAPRQRRPKHRRQGRRVQGECVVEVAEPRHPAVHDESDLAALEYLTQR